MSNTKAKKKKLLPLKIITYLFLIFFLCAFLCGEISCMRFPSGKSLTVHFKFASIVFIYIATLLPFFFLSIWTVCKFGRNKTTMIVLGLFALSYVIRILLADFISNDYIIYLSEWVKEYQSLSIQDCFIQQVGNYTPFYNYFLILFSRLPISSLYLIKTFSFYFEVATAIVVMKLIAAVKKEKVSVIHLAVTLLLVIPLFNSSQWGQCDTIYTFFAVTGIYFAIQHKSAWCFVMMGFGFAIKMQMLFIYPVILILLLCKNSNGEKYLSWKHIWVTPLAFSVINIIPIFFDGSIFKIIEVYQNQIFVGNLSQALCGNCANVFMWFTLISRTSIWYPILTFLFIGIVAVILTLIIVRVCKTRINQLETHHVILLSAFIPMVCVFFMPKMLDRYFYIAEIFMFIYMMIASEKKLTCLVYVLFEYGILITYITYFKVINKVLIYSIYPATNILTGIAVVLISIHFLKQFKHENKLPINLDTEI